ncbi:P-type conjugative transfer protein TrbJ [Fusobacterium animalis F0419]|uniref:P-type conjugative transfer protein TrbJ n=1 Tax=Fusobacterium animalis F0419 TaxID=999414 RepID=H1HC05_9FUSO|nr:hypothetical protein [Fusobacterium animalis]EHO79974.1 P-type conjugative transfer protein TrbJ [Fusobacterium animalis F0419]
MKKIKILIMALLLIGISVNSTAGIFKGRGSSAGLKKIITILVAMQAKQALMATDLGKELNEAIQQTQNQLKQIEMEMTNMMDLGQELTTGQLMKIQQDYQELMNIQNQFKDTISSFKNFEKSFKNTYEDFKNLEGLSPEEYMRKADDLLSATKDITKSSFAIAGLGDPDRLANDTQRISELMKAANTAEGQKAVLQAGVNMAAEQTKVLLELRTLLASSLKTQNAEEMRRIQNEKAELEHEKAVMTYRPSKEYKKPNLLNGRKW